MIKKFVLIATLPLLFAACHSFSQTVDRIQSGDNPYSETPFYARYLDPANNALDARIDALVNQLRENPESPVLHNELGALLLRKGFPKDAELEFRRATWADSDFYAAWYNLGVLRESMGDRSGAASALKRTVRIKPGHAKAHFHLGLIYEQQGRKEAAIEHYAKAIGIDHAMLDIRHNPRILDTSLIDLALIKLYPTEHRREALSFQPPPDGYLDDTIREAASEQAAPSEIVTPAPPVTNQAVQPALPPTAAAPLPPAQPQTRAAQQPQAVPANPDSTAEEETEEQMPSTNVGVASPSPSPSPTPPPQ